MNLGNLRTALQAVNPGVARTCYFGEHVPGDNTSLFSHVDLPLLSHVELPLNRLSRTVNPWEHDLKTSMIDVVRAGCTYPLGHNR